MTRPVWIDRRALLAIHAEQIADHGGTPGVRDETLLDWKLSRPRNLVAFSEPTHEQLAAAYAGGIARDRPFVDGNDRTAFLAAYTFLRRNGLELTASEPEAAAAMLALGDGTLTEAQFALWLRDHMREL